MSSETKPQQRSPTGFDVEAGFRYASRLRGPVAEMNPLDWTADWADAPWPFKVYEGGRRVALPLVGPEWLPPAEPTGAWPLGSALFVSVGCTRVRVRPGGMVHSAPERPVPLNRSATLATRRAIASGGALYPAEVYVWATTGCAGIPPGRYHYDPARHELVELSADPLPERLADALRTADRRSVPGLAFVVTHYFWKNFFKYADFGYRLGAVDLGIAVGRLDRMVRARFGEARTLFDFDDRLVNDAFGLDGANESTYAVIASSGSIPIAAASGAARTRPVALEGPRPRQKSRNIKRTADFDAMHASILASCRDLARRPAPAATAAAIAQLDTAERVPLPPPSRELLADPTAAILGRTSNGELFTTAGPPAPAEALSALLAEAAAPATPARLELFVLVQRVAGIAAGAYRYDDRSGSLVAGQRGDLGLRLQGCSNVQNINVDLSAFTVHIAGRLDFRECWRENRAYRIQQMRVGAVLDAIQLAAVALGLGSHPMLGFRAAAVDALHGIDGSGIGVLAQICVGAVRAGYQLEGGIAP